MLRILRVLAPNPGPFTLEGTNTWIVGRDPCAVIDPGPDLPGHLEAIGREAGPVGLILLTHDHPDHAPGARPLAEATGAPVLSWGEEPGAQALRDGQVVAAGGAMIETVHTPGHTPDHVAFWIESEKALFTGDAVLGRGTTVVDPPEGDLGEYLHSLRRMRDLRPDTIYPGHGPTVFRGVDKLEEYLAHRAEREAQVIEALRSGPATAMDLVATIYAEDTPPELHPAAARQVLAHLLKMERDEKVIRTARGEEPRWALPEPCRQCGRPALPGSRLCRRCSVAALQEGPRR